MANGKPGRPAKYAPEFKRNAVDHYLASGKTQRELVRILRVASQARGAARPPGRFCASPRLGTSRSAATAAGRTSP